MLKGRWGHGDVLPPRGAMGCVTDGVEEAVGRARSRPRACLHQGCAGVLSILLLIPNSPVLTLSRPSSLYPIAQLGQRKALPPKPSLDVPVLEGFITQQHRGPSSPVSSHGDREELPTPSTQGGN